ncbi:MAG: PQQ-dependent sugar dehydrogenase [Flavobacteriales bacterium]|nr:PQQ-dependent sugar dehydrogenase [Flavobacteriales bacterium]
MNLMPTSPRRHVLLLLLVSLLHGPWAGAQTVPSGFSDGLVMGGWVEPVGFAPLSPTRYYVWEKRGIVWVVDNGVKLGTPLIDLSQEVGNWRDHGLLGFALDPAFQSNGRFYLMYTVDRHHLMNFGTASYNPATDEYYAATIMRITRYTANLPALTTSDPASRLVLFGETKETGAAMLHESHSTGQLVFGTDGTLLATMGDAASYNNVDVGSDAGTYYAQALIDGIIRPAENVGAMRSQLLNCHNGKVLRLDPATGNGVPSNPYYDATAPRSPKSRVWAMGLRNPYRMTLRPGSGSTDPAAGDPGTLYIGDVGWNLWEELNVCYEAGMNFGWPLFEGMEASAAYTSTTVYNMDEPNPLYGGTCTQPYFQFKDLLKQDTPVHLNGHPNPCDAAQQIPSSTPKYYHARPSIDWAHGNQSRSAGFSGSTAVTYDLDAFGAPVPGPRFGGYASVGGTWVTGTGWPAGYQNVYFNADYAGGWIKRFNYDGADLPVSVHDFATGMGAVVFLKEGSDGCIWYVRYETGELRKVCPLGITNLNPVAVIAQSAQYGPGPLTVQFNGAGSSDPENGALTYAWDFGNGQTSTAVNPSMTFSAPPNTPTTFTITLTVTDPQGATNTTTAIVSVNNTPPTVAITSFPDGHFYPIGVDTIYDLEASVTDAEHSGAQLTYAWQTILHHNTHIHPESVDPNPVSTTVISGVGCDGQTFSYEVKLKVTDAGGLSTTVTHWLYPRCYAVAPTAVILSDKVAGTGPLSVNFDATASSDPGAIVSYVWDFGDGTSATGATPTKVFSDGGDHQVTLTVTDNDGLTGTATKVITVVTLDPPQCPGQAGSITRQLFSSVSGSTVADLVNSPNYPGNPTSTTYPTSFTGPVNAGNNYGARYRGYILAPTTGNYVFTVVADDAAEVYLSLNAEPRLKQLVCWLPSAVNPGVFNGFPSQTSVSIPLVAGKYYYVEMLHKEGSGGDHASLYWQTPTNSTRAIIPGSALYRYVDCQPGLSLRANLDGAFRSSNNLMVDSLRTKGLIPTIEPFTALGFTRPGGGGETVTPALLGVTGPNAIVDWVLVELRNKNNPSQIVTTRAALLQRDGDIIGTDGYRRLNFSVAADNYYVAVRHRNHLGVMTATSQALNANDRYIDLTLGATATYGTDARRQLNGDRWGLWSGNAVRDNTVKYTGSGNDRDQVLSIIGGLVPTNTFSGYSQGDLNLDGLVKYTGSANDRDKVLFVIGGLVPTNTRTEQLP